MAAESPNFLGSLPSEEALCPISKIVNESKQAIDEFCWGNRDFDQVRELSKETITVLERKWLACHEATKLLTEEMNVLKREENAMLLNELGEKKSRLALKMVILTDAIRRLPLHLDDYQ